MNAPTVYLGALDWDWPHWPGRFYPEDLPEDWRLAFYNTQFGCVWLPEARWSSRAGDLAAWLAETRPDFRFLGPAGGAWAAEAARHAASGQVSAHAPDDPDVLWFARDTNVRELADRLRARRSAGGARYLISQDGDLAAIARAQALLGVLGLGSGAPVG